MGVVITDKGHFNIKCLHVTVCNWYLVKSKLPAVQTLSASAASYLADDILSTGLGVLQLSIFECFQLLHSTFQSFMEMIDFVKFIALLEKYFGTDQRSWLGC